MQRAHAGTEATCVAWVVWRGSAASTGNRLCVPVGPVSSQRTVSLAPTEANAVPRPIRRCTRNARGADQSPPQQVTFLSLRTAHPWSSPVATAVNDPDGALVLSKSESPQQVTDPLVRSPHVCQREADMAVNFPDGASDWPYLFQPQHSIVASLCSPHEAGP